MAKAKVVQIPTRSLRTGARRRARAIRKWTRKGYRYAGSVRWGTELVFIKDDEI